MDVLTAPAPTAALPMPASPPAAGGAGGFGALVAGLMDAVAPVAGDEEQGEPAVASPDATIFAAPTTPAVAPPPMLVPPIAVPAVPSPPAVPPPDVSDGTVLSGAAVLDVANRTAGADTPEAPRVAQAAMAAAAAPAAAPAQPAPPPQDLSPPILSQKDMQGGPSFAIPPGLAPTTGDAPPAPVAAASPIATAPTSTARPDAKPVMVPLVPSAPDAPPAATPPATPPARGAAHPGATQVDATAPELTAAVVAGASLAAPMPRAATLPGRDTERSRPAAVGIGTASGASPPEPPLAHAGTHAAPPVAPPDRALPRGEDAALAAETHAPDAAPPAPVSLAVLPEPRPPPLESAGAPPATTPEPPPPTRQPGQIPWPARQVAPFAVAVALGPDNGSFNFTLDPGELGRVEVAIDRSGAEPQVSLRAERPETLALLLRDRAELERALTDAGLGGQDGRGPTLSFGLGGESGTGRERRSPSGGAPQGSRTAPEPPAPTRAAGARGLLDLAV